MAFGLRDFFANPMVAGFIDLFGGAFLTWVGFGMIKSAMSQSVSLEHHGAQSAGGKILFWQGFLLVPQVRILYPGGLQQGWN